MRQALAGAELWRYGYVAYLEDARFLPDSDAWRCLMRRFREARTDIVAGRASFVARAATLARHGFAVEQLTKPGLCCRLGDFAKGRFR